MSAAHAENLAGVSSAPAPAPVWSAIASCPASRSGAGGQENHAAPKHRLTLLFLFRWLYHTILTAPPRPSTAQSRSKQLPGLLPAASIPEVTICLAVLSALLAVPASPSRHHRFTGPFRQTLARTLKGHYRDLEQLQAEAEATEAFVAGLTDLPDLLGCFANPADAFSRVLCPPDTAGAAVCSESHRWHTRRRIQNCVHRLVPKHRGLFAKRPATARTESTYRLADTVPQMREENREEMEQAGFNFPEPAGAVVPAAPPRTRSQGVLLVESVAALSVYSTWPRRNNGGSPPGSTAVLSVCAWCQHVRGSDKESELLVSGDSLVLFSTLSRRARAHSRVSGVVANTAGPGLPAAQPQELTPAPLRSPPTTGSSTGTCASSWMCGEGDGDAGWGRDLVPADNESLLGCLEGTRVWAVHEERKRLVLGSHSFLDMRCRQTRGVVDVVAPVGSTTPYPLTRSYSDQMTKRRSVSNWVWRPTAALAQSQWLSSMEALTAMVGKAVSEAENSSVGRAVLSIGRPQSQDRVRLTRASSFSSPRERLGRALLAAVGCDPSRVRSMAGVSVAIPKPPPGCYEYVAGSAGLCPASPTRPARERRPAGWMGAGNRPIAAGNGPGHYAAGVRRQRAGGAEPSR